MKKLWLPIAAFIVTFLLVSARTAAAQKTCVKNTAGTAQTCTVTLSWQPSQVDASHDAPQIYTPRRSDGAGNKTPIGNVTANVFSFQNSFTDTGNIQHCFDVIATNSAGSSPPSPQQCWTSPTLQVNPPNASPNTTLSNFGLDNYNA